MATELVTSAAVERLVVGPGAPVAVPRRWRNLAAITGVEVVDSAEAGLVNTVFPAIAASLRLDSGHLGLLSAAGKLASAPFGPAWVWLAGRIGRKAALIGTTVTGGIFGVLAGFSESFLALLLFNTLMSACLIGGQPISNAIIADSFDDKTRGIATGYFYGAIVAVSSFMGPLLALFTEGEDGWRYGMWTIGNTLNALRHGDWKLHVRRVSNLTRFTGRVDRSATADMPQLFDLSRDPEECYDLSKRYPGSVAEMQARLTAFDTALKADHAARYGG